MDLFFIQLGGRVQNTFTERGLVSGAANVDIVSTSTTLSPSTGQWAFEHHFSMPIPSYAMGRHTLLPPSYMLYQPGVTSEIKYWIKATVVRKGFRRNDRQVDLRT